MKTLIQIFAACTMFLSIQATAHAGMVAGGATALSPQAETVVHKTGAKRNKFFAGLVIGAAVAANLATQKSHNRTRGYALPVSSCPVGTRPIPETDACAPYATNKYGFTTEKVWNRPGCKKLERKCNRGNTRACFKYEDRCQIN
ncbi:MAG: hypothetical protein AAFV45_05195 [Pseudomonadota bacterium]